jgi:hypothetical protein
MYPRVSDAWARYLAHSSIWIGKGIVYAYAGLGLTLGLIHYLGGDDGESESSPTMQVAATGS